MLQSLRIENFKCLRDVTVELEPFTVLIGPNDSGKTSFLQAIELLRCLVTHKSPVKPPMIWQVKNDLIVRLNVAATDDENNIVRIPLEVDSQVGQFTEKFIQGNCGMAKSLASSQMYRLKPEVMRDPAEPKNDASLNEDGSNLAAVLHSMLSGPDRQAVIDLERKLNEEIPTLKGIFTPLVESNKVGIRFTLNVETKPSISISSEEASDGAMLLLGFLVLVFGNAPDILLIEEPENGLHPSRLDKVVDILRKISKGQIGNKARQVIITTHNPLLLNFVQPSEVRIFSRSKDTGDTRVEKMDALPNIDRLSKEFAPGELWYLYGEENLLAGNAT